jgi:hypothetical protein
MIRKTAFNRARLIFRLRLLLVALTTLFISIKLLDTCGLELRLRTYQKVFRNDLISAHAYINDMPFDDIYKGHVSRTYDLVEMLGPSLPEWQKYMDLLDQISLGKLQMDTDYYTSYAGLGVPRCQR